MAWPKQAAGNQMGGRVFGGARGPQAEGPTQLGKQPGRKVDPKAARAQLLAGLRGPSKG